ncbi:MAG: DUF4160 domain-containing protein [Candidatus Omnitrophica bacterium]|nr:DUF4160 domain-containing protein [Candidatus Omnitrophota bacterium]
MSPTIFRYKSFRFFFFSREETRIHVHVSCPNGEAKFWMEPVVALANYSGLSAVHLRELQGIVEERKSEIAKAWRSHFKT